MYETQISSADKIMQHLADAPCLRSSHYPYSQRTNWRYTLYYTA